MLAGADAALLEHVAANLRLSDGAARLIRVLKRHGYRTAILSGGFQQVGERLRARLGIDHVFANTLEIEDGRLTGRVSGTVVDGARKAALLRELVQREGLRMAQAIAVGDGANDLPMLSIAGLGVAFRAKPIVAESADHAITHFGLDAILYLIGFSERDVREAEADGPSDLQGDARHATAPLPGHSSTVKT
jgi:phosphoserine phosphatase